MNTKQKTWWQGVLTGALTSLACVVVGYNAVDALTEPDYTITVQKTGDQYNWCYNGHLYKMSGPADKTISELLRALNEDAEENGWNGVPEWDFKVPVTELELRVKEDF
jgi:hypothetical protein